MAIDELLAGRELDALIAEKVMGWKRIPVPPDANGHFAGEALMQTDPPPNFRWNPLGKIPFDTWVPHFSTDIAAAWQVVEKLVAEGYCPALLYDDEGHWGLFFDGVSQAEAQPESYVVFTTPAWADTAPLAICLAALKAKGDST